MNTAAAPTIVLNGKTLWLVVVDGISYGYMRPSARREFLARKGLSIGFN